MKGELLDSVQFCRTSNNIEIKNNKKDLSKEDMKGSRRSEFAHDVCPVFPDTAIVCQEHPAFQVDLSRIQYRLEAKLKWSTERAERAMSEYRRFIYIVGTVKGRFVPSNEVDEVWHAHILHTALYAKHCDRVCGRFIHHRPSDPPTADGESAESERQDYVETLKTYTRVFTVTPDSSVWPHPDDTDREGACDECGSIRCRSQCPSCNADCDSGDAQ